ncbi:MAG: hypothetical protein GX030_04050 [Firmicutes bacterium]|nr:hypothetical protein [Bacillota bacterium]
MKKILVLTLAMVFALASVAFAEVKISGELKSTVKYNVVDDGEEYKGAALDTAKVTLAAEEEGGWAASVTL